MKNQWKLEKKNVLRNIEQDISAALTVSLDPKVHYGGRKDNIELW